VKVGVPNLVKAAIRKNLFLFIGGVFGWHCIVSFSYLGLNGAFSLLATLVLMAPAAFAIPPEDTTRDGGLHL
jgi:hypothetical protein